MTTAIRHRVTLRLAAVAAGLVGLPAAAQAHRGLRIDVDVPVVVQPVVVEPSCPPPVVVGQPAPVWVGPTYRTVCDRQWVEPVVQTVTTRVWVPPVTSTATQRVFVPDQFGWRNVVAYDGWGRPYRARQQVLVSPAHYEDACQPVVVTPGHFEDVPQQQVVAEGHWANVERQELVTPGHWEAASVAGPVGVPVVVPVCPPHRGFHIRLPF